ncbi:MAG: YchJ family protein [Thiotrichaceae bacterium]|nr:YchJ family protein [Thiotrichaceae bacterium]
MKKKIVEICPCGNQQTYMQCCAPYHQGNKKPTTAEALMRSRYTAFVFELKDYLLVTWHSSTRPKQLQFEPNTIWLGLKVKACEAGLQDDNQGMVSFVARYKIQGKAHRLIENSRFIKQQEQWFYVDADVEENV